MLSKTRTTIIALVAAFGVAGVAAVPASARAKLICTGAGTGNLNCRYAKGCTLTLKLPDGSTAVSEYEDGETETFTGKHYKCRDGKWVALVGGATPAYVATTSGMLVFFSPPPAQSITPPLSAGAHA